MVRVNGAERPRHQRSIRSTALGEQFNLEALPENNLWSILLVFLLTDPRRAEGGHAGQNRSSSPHQEVSAFGARHAYSRSYVYRHQAFNFRLETLGQAWQQGVPTFSQKQQKQSARIDTLNRSSLNNTERTS